VGVAQGGVWKTTDGGTTWTPLTDDLPMLRVSDIAVDPTDPDIMYIAMGDYAYFGAGLTLDDRKRHTHYGLGIYKTTDGGQSWNPTGLSIAQTDFDFSLTRRTLIHPTNTSTLLAAGTHGVYRSTDAGGSWTQINDSLIWDLEADPANPNIVYASTGFRATLNVGRAGVLKSTDFGQTWTALNTGIPPTNVIQRVEIAISPADPNYIYALCADMNAAFGGMYRSTDAGSTWNLQASFPNILTWGDGTGGGGQGWYDLAILPHPTDRNTVYTGGVNMWGTSDGGLTWDGCSYWINAFGASLHADQHQFQYNPVSGLYYVCNDGGLYSAPAISIGSWDDANNQPGYQWPTTWTKLSGGMQATSFYRLGTSANNPGYLIAGAQDNSTYFYNNQFWLNTIGGDGMECIIHPNDPNILYGSSQYGNLDVSYNGGLNTQGISWGIGESGEWTTPFVMDPNNPSTLYAAYGHVYKTTNEGNSWTQMGNFPINNTLGQPNISSALAVAPSNTDYIYCAKRFYYSFNEPSALWVTTDHGATWTDRSAGLPDSLYLTYIAVDGDDPQTAWVTVGGFTAGVKVYKTSDAGATWTNISGNLPNLPANCVVHDGAHPNNPVYVGLDAGVYYTNDTMSNWVLYADDLPNVVVSELEIHVATEQLYAATFGRGIWGVDLKDAVISSVDGQQLQAVDMQLWPNPNSGNFNLRLEGLTFSEANLDVVDVMGRVVFEEVLRFGGAEFERGFAPDLGGGLYFVRVRKGNLSLSKRMVVK
ncbi:MAG: T9SS type A sorting domain-containing protein, partial [Bacteroidota bacterium]